MANQEHAFHWPALDLAGRELPAGISCERGIWGKAHGSPSDFHWIATSPGFAGLESQIERELALGAEDVPATAALWRVADGRYYAVAVYPSLAVDAAGRSGFLEKRMFEWKRPDAVPAALGALLLLSAVTRLDANDWREERSDVRWSDDDAVDLAPFPPLPVSIGTLEEAIARGVQILRESTSEDTLTDFYASLLAGNRGVALRGITNPLPPAALAVLLLPLPRSIADDLSIAGWLPSTWLSESGAQDVRRCWNAVLGGTTTPAAQSAAPTDEHLREARAMASSIFARTPRGRAGMRITAESAIDDGVKPVQLALWGPSAAGKTALLAKLFVDADDEQWEVFPTQGSLGFIHSMRTRMKIANQFPPATNVRAPEEIEYVFRHRTSGTVASLHLEDRAGVESEDLQKELGGTVSLRTRLGTVDGLVLVFDPTSDQAALENCVLQSLELLYVTSGRQAGKDARPIAVCVSKADLLIEHPADFRRALETPDEFVRDRVASVLVTALDRYCSNYRLFPFSAAGVRLRQGMIEPAVFLDETLQPRICPGGRPFNLMAPFSWLLAQLTEAS
jgi:hypothetical protein